MNLEHSRFALLAELHNGQGAVRVQFQDTGVGIPPGNLNKIFDPFFTTKPVGKGTGLGLSICYGIVRQSPRIHQGRVGSGQGKHVSYPAACQGQIKGGFAMPAGKKIKLLIADDEKNVSLILQKELARRNYEVSVANDGRSAVEFAQKVDYDVIVMDMTMPQMDGIQALKVIKQAEPSPEIIMLTGNATLETAIEAMKAGAYDYLTKPCKIEELDVLIRKACERRDLQKENLYMQTRLSRKESAPLSGYEQPQDERTARPRREDGGYRLQCLDPGGEWHR